MQKTTVEYFRDKNNISGYSYLISPKQLSEAAVLDFLCKWSKDKNVTVYSHSLKRVDENISKTKFYYACQGSLSQKEAEKEYNKNSLWRDKGNYKIPYCDWVYYLDIWWQ
jgi:hypothetical protein